MRLRPLEMKDALFMLEWMHDESVVKNLATDFMNKSIEDCRDFIQSSKKDTADLHMAIVDDDDEYMGTVKKKLNASTPSTDAETP